MRKRTLAQIEAARRNGARSKGPLSPETKAISARNAIKHGLTGKTILLEGECPDRFQQLLSEIVEELDPQSTLEFTAVEEIAVALWKQRRAWAMEAASFRAASAKLAGGPDPADPGARAVRSWSHLHRKGHDFQNLLHQQARIDRQLDRAYRRFVQFTALRPSTAAPPIDPETIPESPQPVETTSPQEEN